MVAHGVSRGWILGIQPVAEFARIRKSIARSEFLRIRLQTQKNTTSEALPRRGDTLARLPRGIRSCHRAFISLATKSVAPPGLKRLCCF